MNGEGFRRVVHGNPEGRTSMKPKMLSTSYSQPAT